MLCVSKCEESMEEMRLQDTGARLQGFVLGLGCHGQICVL